MDPGRQDDTTMIHIETAPIRSDRWTRMSSHSSLASALDAADRAGVPDSVIVRVTADPATLATLRAEREVIDTHRGETIDRDHRWAIVEAG